MYFKVGVFVVVVYKILKNIYNDIRVIFFVKDGEDVFVEIDGVVVKIKRKIWFSYNVEGRIIGVRF